MSNVIIKESLAEDEYLVPVTWEMSGYVIAKGKSPEEAYDNVKNNPDDYNLPIDQTYVDASFAPTFENAEMVQVYTNLYKKGELNITISH